MQITPAVKKPWTVMVWSASDNDLYKEQVADLDHMERVGSTDQAHMVAQIDLRPSGRDVRRYELHEDSQPGLRSPIKERIKNCDMANPQNLTDFVRWSMKNYPAENYFLVMSDHGAGWKGACEDQSHHGWMDLPTIEAGLKEAREKTGKKIDVIGFDACLMASTETAYQLRNEANYLVASEEVEGGAGWQYNRVLSEKTLGGVEQAMQAAAAMRVNFTPAQMASSVVSMAQGNQGDLPTMSAVDLSKMDGLKAATDNLSQAILDSSQPGSAFAAHANKTQGFTDFKDFKDFTNRLSGIGDDKVKAAAAAVGEAITDSLVAEQHSSKYPGANGLNIELNRGGSAYGKTAWAKDSKWDEALAKIRG